MFQLIAFHRIVFIHPSSLITQ